jgi:hypothetical protein
MSYRHGKSGVHHLLVALTKYWVVSEQPDRGAAGAMEVSWGVSNHPRLQPSALPRA